MAKLLADFCCVLQEEPAVLAITLFFLFLAIGGVYMSGIRGRRRLWKEKVEKYEFHEMMGDVKVTMARLEKRMWDLGTKKKQEPLSQETIDLVNNQG